MESSGPQYEGFGRMITEYHAIYYAHELSRIGGTGVDRLGRVLFDACVDLNPHQIEAALFALRSPLSKGVLLADEVGLGKTIEAGLVLCQHWAERKRNILVICPASLRKQWALELIEKFNLPSIVLDAKTYKDQIKSGIPNPFRDKQIIICSIHFASSRAEELKEIAWDRRVRYPCGRPDRDLQLSDRPARAAHIRAANLSGGFQAHHGPGAARRPTHQAGGGWPHPPGRRWPVVVPQGGGLGAQGRGQSQQWPAGKGPSCLAQAHRRH